MSNLIIFDLDGVITSEEAYWDTAGLTLHELMYSQNYWGLDRVATELGVSEVPGSRVPTRGTPTMDGDNQRGPSHRVPTRGTPTMDGDNQRGPSHRVPTRGTPTMDGVHSTPVPHYVPARTAEESRRVSRAVFPEVDILALKARAINSNWDTCYATVCLYLISLMRYLKEALPQEDFLRLLPLRPEDADWIAEFRDLLVMLAPTMTLLNLQAFFDSPVASGYIGLELINRLDAYASEVLGGGEGVALSRSSPFWTFCQNIFQEWYLGDDLYTQVYGHAPAQLGKPGCIHFEHPLLPLEQLHTTLKRLREQGYVLGIATGRRRQEAVYPLEMYGLLGKTVGGMDSGGCPDYFDEEHISTYDDVERAEAALRIHGDSTLLGKPHPFPFLVAAERESAMRGAINRAPTALPATERDVLGGHDQLSPHIVVGDAPSDILGGRTAGALLTVAVLTGARTPEARDRLALSNPDFTIDDVTKLPALLEHVDSLATIQRLQWTEREKAERLLQLWFVRHMHLGTESVTLMPKAVSLNSFNGYYRSEGEEYFFKTHVEEQGVIEEYYHAELLHAAGYNVVKPLRTLHEEGRQMVIYPVVKWPVVFDLVRAVELGNAGDVTIEMLASAEQQECDRLRSIYRSTLAFSAAREHTQAPIHQLFWHRLTGGRFKSFYEGKEVPFPSSTRSPINQAPTPFGENYQGNGMPFKELLNCKWVINGILQQRTLGELVEQAKIVLHPAQAAMTVIGHGDAHFGNVFLENASGVGAQCIAPLKKYLYFDPAFAGRHSPLLDVVKPLFHNVFATWMYFPHDVADDLNISVNAHGRTISVEHNYTLTAIRRAILQTKMEHLLIPLMEELRLQEALPLYWVEMIQLALMCCALLTINLLDTERIGGMPTSISWLGLLLAVQMGNTGVQSWREAK